MTRTASTSPRAEFMNAALADNWWALALRGAIAIIFCFIAFFMPGVTMLSLVLVFAAYCVVDGIFSIVAAVRGARRGERWLLLLLNGVLGLLVGAVAFLWPGITLIAFVYLIAAWAVVSGALLIGSALAMKRSHGRGWMIAAGVISVIYAAVLMVAPLVGALVLTWWLGAYALILGVTLLVLSFRLRRHRGEHPSDHLAAPA